MAKNVNWFGNCTRLDEIMLLHGVWIDLVGWLAGWLAEAVFDSHSWMWGISVAWIWCGSHFGHVEKLEQVLCTYILISSWRYNPVLGEVHIAPPLWCSECKSVCQTVHGSILYYCLRLFGELSIIVLQAKKPVLFISYYFPSHYYS